MKKLFVLMISFMLFGFANAEQYVEAKIIFRNDSVLTGLATLPNDPPDAPIFYKEDKKAKSRKIVYTDVKTIIYYTAPGKTLEYDVVWTDMGSGRDHHQEKYLKAVLRGPVTLYQYVNMNGPNKYDQDTYFLCLRPGEQTVTLIAGSYRKLKKDLFRQAVSEYFKDDPELVAKVMAGQYKWSDMDQIVNEYNQKKKPS
ncbi:MAG: hypothetical protein ABJB86_02760 [Bacteroidota bacterium]